MIRALVYINVALLLLVGALMPAHAGPIWPVVTPIDWQPDYCQAYDGNYFVPCHDIEPDIMET